MLALCYPLQLADPQALRFDDNMYAVIASPKGTVVNMLALCYPPQLADPQTLRPLALFFSKLVTMNSHLVHRLW
jgi:hypothetical protein